MNMKKEKHLFLMIEQKCRSSTAVNTETKENRPGMMTVEENTNAAMDGLRDIEAELLNLNKMINEMKTVGKSK